MKKTPYLWEYKVEINAIIANFVCVVTVGNTCVPGKVHWLVLNGPETPFY